MKQEFSAFNFELWIWIRDRYYKDRDIKIKKEIDRAIVKILSFRNITSITKYQYCLSLALGMNVNHMES